MICKTAPLLEPHHWCEAHGFNNLNLHLYYQASLEKIDISNPCSASEKGLLS